MLCVISLLFASTSSAKSPNLSAELLKQIHSHLVEKEYNEAIKKMEALYDLKPRPVILFNIAVAKEKLGLLCEEKVKAYDRFFDECHGCRAEKKAKARIEAIYTECAYGMLTIKTQPSGMTVNVDGRTIGVGPVSRRVSPGQHKITAMNSDGRVHQSIQMGRSGAIIVTLELAQEGSNDVDSSKDQPAPLLGGQSVTPTVTDSRMLEWSLVGSGLVLTGVGTFLISDGNSTIESAKKEAQESRRWVDYEAAEHEGKWSQTQGAILIGVGAATVIGTVVWWWLDGPTENKTSKTGAVMPWFSLGVGPGMVYLEGPL